METRREPTPGLAVAAALAAGFGLFALNIFTQPVYLWIERVWGPATALGFGATCAELGLFIPLVALVLFARLDLKSTFGLRRPPLAATLAAIVATVGGGVLVDQAMFLTLQLVPDWRSGNLEVVGRTISEAGLVGALLLLVPLALLPAIVEESLCRGILLRGLQARYPSGWIPLVVTALFFGSLHFDPLHVSAAVLMGLLLGWVALRTGSIWPPVACHLVNNAISLLTPALGGPDLGDVLARGHSPLVVGGGALALLAGIIGIWRVTRPSLSALIGARHEILPPDTDEGELPEEE